MVAGVTTTDPSALPLVARTVEAYRLINSRFPPIALFDDVATADEFETLYALQSLTNPRLLAETGEISLLPTASIPFGIPGCSYAVAPFTHVNPDGSRFSDGSYGVLYAADTIDTAIAEVQHHQTLYWQNVAGLQFDRLMYRGLRCNFAAERLRDATGLDSGEPIYDPDSYGDSRAFGAACLDSGDDGIEYRSVRAAGRVCWGLFTPAVVSSVVQVGHYSMVWDGVEISSVNLVSGV